MRARVKELESKLAAAQQQRDDLAKDLEIMCLESKPVTFDTSSVLRERIFATGPSSMMFDACVCVIICVCL